MSKGPRSETPFGFVVKIIIFRNRYTEFLCERAHHVIPQANDDSQHNFSTFIVQALNQNFRNRTYISQIILFYLCLALPMPCHMPCCIKMKIKFKVGWGPWKDFNCKTILVKTKQQLQASCPTTHQQQQPNDQNETSQVIILKTKPFQHIASCTTARLSNWPNMAGGWL